MPRVWASRLTLVQKLEATVHLMQYSVAFFMLLMVCCGRLLLNAVPYDMQRTWTQWTYPLIPLMIAGPIASYIYARWSVGGGLGGLWTVPKLIVMSLGLSLNNTYACLIGLVQRGGEFVRTPKSGSSGRRLRRQSYSALRSRLWLAELSIGSACFLQWALYLERDHYFGGTFMLLYAIGLCSLGWASRPWAAEAKAKTRPTPVISPSPTPAA